MTNLEIESVLVSAVAGALGVPCADFPAVIALARIRALESAAKLEGQAEDRPFIAKKDALGRVRFVRLVDDYDVNGRRTTWSHVFVEMMKAAEANI
jgi:hypothetical protein